MEKKNLYDRIPDDLPNEAFELLAQSKEVKIERIISKGHSSPEVGWYEQKHNEWVVVLRGAATIEFENDSIIMLKEGDYVNIPAHKRHKVVSTGSNPETIWLAVHY